MSSLVLYPGNCRLLFEGKGQSSSLGFFVFFFKVKVTFIPEYPVQILRAD